VVFLQQGQLEKRQPRRQLDRPQRRLQAPFRTGGDDKPEVVVVLAFVVVVDLGKARDRRSHRRQLLRRHRHRRQGAGTDPLGGKDGADARHLALAAQRLEHAQDGTLGDTQSGCQLGKRCRTQREVALEIVEQTEVECVVGHRGQNPVRPARLVKKMPLGACAANSPILAKVAVS